LQNNHFDGIPLVLMMNDELWAGLNYKWLLLLYYICCYTHKPYFYLSSFLISCNMLYAARLIPHSDEHLEAMLQRWQYLWWGFIAAAVVRQRLSKVGRTFIPLLQNSTY
jgi:hypothetical protein